MVSSTVLKKACVSALVAFYLLAGCVVVVPVLAGQELRTPAGRPSDRSVNGMRKQGLGVVTQQAPYSHSLQETGNANASSKRQTGSSSEVGQGSPRQIATSPPMRGRSSSALTPRGKSEPTTRHQNLGGPEPREGILSSSNQRMENAILFLTALILVLGLVVGFLNWQIMRESREAMTGLREQLRDFRIEMKDQRKSVDDKNETMKKEIQDSIGKESRAIDEKIRWRVEFLFQSRLSSIGEEVSKIAKDTITSYFDEDFTSDLEKRYLRAEYVRNCTWSQVSAKMNAMMEREPWDHSEASELWSHFFRAQLGLRQVLSGDARDVFTGLGNMRVLAKEGIVPAGPLWNLICLLKEQKRLSWENLDLARRLGRDIGKTFADCQTPDQDRLRKKRSKDPTTQPVDEKGEKLEDKEK